MIENCSKHWLPGLSKTLRQARTSAGTTSWRRGRMHRSLGKHDAPGKNPSTLPKLIRWPGLQQRKFHVITGPIPAVLAAVRDPAGPGAPSRWDRAQWRAGEAQPIDQTNLVHHWMALFDRGELATAEAETVAVVVYEAKLAALERKVGHSSSSGNCSKTRRAFNS